MRIRSSLLAALLVAAAWPVQAHEFKVGDLQVDHPWARATAGNAPNGAAYLTVQNAGHHADRLVAAESPVAAKVELHTHTMDGGIMRMRRIDAVEVHPGEPAVFAPGGNHIMLLGLRKALKEGDEFPLTLTFANAGKVTVQVEVAGVASMGPDHGSPMPEMQHEHGSSMQHEHQQQ